MTWGDAEYRRFREQEQRDGFADQQADQEAARQRNEEIRMSKRMTTQGDRVSRFPDVSNRSKKIADVREALAESFERAERAAALKERMGAVDTLDTARFPVLKDRA